MADLRKCIGSAKFGIEAHDAPPEDFPVQPSQKDGLGRMCKPHWRQYTNALRKAALARKADADPVVAKLASARPRGAAVARAAKKPGAKPAKKPEPIRTRPVRGRKAESEAEPAPIAPGRLSKTDGEQIIEAADVASAAANVEEARIA